MEFMVLRCVTEVGGVAGLYPRLGMRVTVFLRWMWLVQVRLPYQRYICRDVYRKARRTQGH